MSETYTISRARYVKICELESEAIKELDLLRNENKRLSELLQLAYDDRAKAAQDNARLDIELREAKCATDFANLACDRKDAQLATYKAAVVEAREALEYVGCHEHNDETEYPPTESHKTRCAFCDHVDKALHTLSALTGDATKTP